jgi:hypothetical protein
MIHLNLVVKRFTFNFLTFLIIYHLFKCAPNLNWLCHQSITHKTKYETNFSKTNLVHPTYIKNSCNSFKMWQCDWKHPNIHVTTSLFLLWNFAQMWKINMKREYSITSFFEKKITRFVEKWKSCCNISLLVLVW